MSKPMTGVCPVTKRSGLLDSQTGLSVEGQLHKIETGDFKFSRFPILDFNSELGFESRFFGKPVCNISFLPIHINHCTLKPLFKFHPNFLPLRSRTATTLIDGVPKLCNDYIKNCDSQTLFDREENAYQRFLSEVISDLEIVSSNETFLITGVVRVDGDDFKINRSTLTDTRVEKQINGKTVSYDLPISFSDLDYFWTRNNCRKNEFYVFSDFFKTNSVSIAESYFEHFKENLDQGYGVLWSLKSMKKIKNPFLQIDFSYDRSFLQ